ncbi:hypothetical protein RINTHH_7960 [Richelia intracellularis HH01]|uniref:Uncharacterized protein n=1 Tax=Richelia intracellularis HH01 TaxID=1165094 RepID=M1X4Z8_9NOST|nr:hypothetical protein RINTHH_7960 [Richelia intracellularis HH01]
MILSNHQIKYCPYQLKSLANISLFVIQIKTELKAIYSRNNTT